MPFPSFHLPAPIGTGLFYAERALVAALLLLIASSQASALADLLRQRVRSDRGSALALVSSWWAVLAVSAIEAWRAPGFWAEPGWAPWAGVAAFGLGLALRVAAVRTLDRHFSPLVELQPEHRLITAGPYAWVRHPAYLGSALWAIAVPLMLGSAGGFAPLLLAYAPALAHRVRTEEALLAGAFGPSWAAYRARVPALVPWRGRWDGQRDGL